MRGAQRQALPDQQRARATASELPADDRAGATGAAVSHTQEQRPFTVQRQFTVTRCDECAVEMHTALADVSYEFKVPEGSVLVSEILSGGGAARRIDFCSWACCVAYGQKQVPTVQPAFTLDNVDMPLLTDEEIVVAGQHRAKRSVVSGILDPI